MFRRYAIGTQLKIKMALLTVWGLQYCNIVS
jgi:hypothetical protein